MQPIREFTRYLDPQGNIYELHVPSKVGRWLISQSGWGTPGIEYITQRGPFQHGETVRDYFLQPRVIQMLIRQDYCSRDAYWTGRASILNAIRPNRQTVPTAVNPGSLERVLPDGSRRRLDVFIAEGPRFEPSQIGKWDEWAFQEVLRFIAHNPVIYDPDVQTVTFVSGSELVFPITFPIIFSSILDTGTAQYDGTWEEYPTIIITGPITGPAIENVTTGEVIALDYAVPAGRVVTISLNGDKTVVDDTGVNLIGTVIPTSDLATFHLAPDPEAPLGANVLNAYGSGTSVATSIAVNFYNRYFGL